MRVCVRLCVYGMCVCVCGGGGTHQRGCILLLLHRCKTLEMMKAAQEIPNSHLIFQMSQEVGRYLQRIRDPLLQVHLRCPSFDSEFVFFFGTFLLIDTVLLGLLYGTDLYLRRIRLHGVHGF